MLASNRGFKGSSIGPSMLVRRLCSSLIRSDARLPRHHQLSCNSASFPDLLLPFARSGSLKSGFPRSGPVTNRCVRSYSQMSGARWPPAVPIPPLETAGRAEVFRALEASLGRSFNSQPLAPSPNPLIIVISGPSGVGKDAVIKKLREVREGIDFVVTATSRARRPGEVDGKDYHFVSKEKFLSMVENEELLEYALVYGEYKGIPKQQVRECMAKGLDIVLRVDIQGAATLRSVFGGSAVFIFLVAESEAELVERLIDRKTETKETLLVRVNTAREELKHLDQFDYAVVNAKGELESAVKLVESIIDAEKAKVLQRAAVV